MDFLLVNKIVLALCNLVGLLFAIFGYFSDKSQKSNKFFFWLALSLIVLIDSAFISFFSQDLFLTSASSFALSGARAMFVCASLFFIFLYFFSIHFPKTGRDSIFFHWIHSLIWLGFVVLSFTSLLISGVDSVDSRFIVQAGPLQAIFFIMAVFSLLYCCFTIASKYRFLQEQDKARSQYFFFGLILWIFFFIIFSVALPLISSNYFQTTYMWGMYCAIIFVATTSFGLFQKTAIGARGVITQLIVFLISLSLIVAPFFVDLTWLKVVYVFVFILFLFFGGFLIKDASKEAQQKIYLQTEVQQRIRELEDVRKRLEESKAVLEIRIGARTRALKDLANNLEEQVKNRTKELERKIAELERANQLMVDRELSMADLKKENTMLKEKLNQQNV